MARVWAPNENYDRSKPAGWGNMPYKRRLEGEESTPEERLKLLEEKERPRRKAWDDEWEARERERELRRSMRRPARRVTPPPQPETKAVQCTTPP